MLPAMVFVYAAIGICAAVLTRIFVFNGIDGDDDPDRCIRIGLFWPVALMLGLTFFILFLIDTVPAAIGDALRKSK